MGLAGISGSQPTTCGDKCERVAVKLFYIDGLGGFGSFKRRWIYDTMWFESARWIRKRGSCSWLNNLGQQIGWQNVRRSEAIFNIALLCGVTMACLILATLVGMITSSCGAMD